MSIQQLVPREELRERVRFAIKNRGVTLEQVSSESGVDSSTLNRFVNNDRQKLFTNNHLRLQIWANINEPANVNGRGIIGALEAIANDPNLTDEAKEALEFFMSLNYHFYKIYHK